MTTPPLQAKITELTNILTLPWIAYFSQLTTFLTPQSYQAATLSGLWLNQAGGFQSAVYWIDSSNTVHLSGVIKRVIGAVAGETILTLPAGYRPANGEMFVISANGAFGQVNIASTGVVSYQVGATITGFSLSGITFKAL